MIVLSSKSLEKLTGVHQDLVRVVIRAAKIADKADDFTIIEGVRSKERMWENWGKGRTVEQCKARGVPIQYAKPSLAKVTWLNNPLMSNHRKREDGFGRAVDCAPFPIDWTDLGRFKRMRELFKRAADLEEVGIRFIDGDWPHIELTD